jgi:hypothetical protein
MSVFPKAAIYAAMVRENQAVLREKISISEEGGVGGGSVADP